MNVCSQVFTLLHQLEFFQKPSTVFAPSAGQASELHASTCWTGEPWVSSQQCCPSLLCSSLASPARTARGESVLKTVTAAKVKMKRNAALINT